MLADPEKKEGGCRWMDANWNDRSSSIYGFSFPHLDQQGELLDAEGARGGEGVEGKVDGGAAAGVPASSRTAAWERPALGRRHRSLAAVKELQHQHQNLVADGADGDDELRRGRGTPAAAATT
jgi:hypothetical protein